MQADWPILSVLVWLPIAAGVLLLLAGDRSASLGRWLALAASLATFAVSVVLWRDFDRGLARLGGARRPVRLPVPLRLRDDHRPLGAARVAPLGEVTHAS